VRSSPSGAGPEAPLGTAGQQGLRTRPPRGSAHPRPGSRSRSGEAGATPHPHWATPPSMPWAVSPWGGGSAQHAALARRGPPHGDCRATQPPARLDVACGQGPPCGAPRLLEHHQQAHARARAVMAALAEAGQGGPPARGARPGTGGHGARAAVHDVIGVSGSPGRRHGVLEEEKRPPQAAAATVAGPRRAQGGQPWPQVCAHLTHAPARTFPGHAAAPWGRQTQAQPLASTHEGGGTAPDGPLGPEMPLVQIVHDDLQGSQEGCESACPGPVSCGERVAMAEDSRRNLRFLSSDEGSICIKRLDVVTGFEAYIALGAAPVRKKRPLVGVLGVVLTSI